MSIQKAVNIYGNIKVLHIDDDTLLTDTTKLSLESLNNNIIIDSINDSSNIINTIIDNYYDCILLDNIMPRENGMSIASKIKNVSDIPIILYTVQSLDEISTVIKNSDIDAYIRKEVNNEHYIILEKLIVNLSNNHRSNKFYQIVTDNIEDFVLAIDKEYKILYYNNNFEKYINKSNLFGQSLLDIFEYTEKDKIINFLKNENKKIDQGVINYNKVNRYVEIHKSKISNRSDNYIIVIKDKTSQIIEKELIESSDIRFKALSKLSNDAILTISRLGYVTYINQAFTDLTGYSYQEIVGKHVVSLPTLRGRNISSYMGLLKHVIEGGLNDIKYDFPYTRKDGSSGIGSAIAKLINANGKQELITIIRDVTIEKQTEEEFKNIFKTSPDGIIHLDIEGNIKNINDSALNILNSSLSNYLGKNIFSLESEIKDSKLDFHNIYEKIISNKEVEPFIIDFDIDNKIKWVEIKVSLIKSLEEALGIQIILRDITQQKETENNRLEYTENLEKLVEERTNQILDNEKMFTLAKVTSMIGHDLKGPLQVISNSIHLIKLRPDNQEQYLEFIQKAVKQGNLLIEEMQQIGKEAPLKIEETKIESIIEETLSQIKTTDNIEFETVINIVDPIKLDKLKFIRIFNNLFKNAIEAMPEGGKITFKAEEKQDKIIFEIIDTGSGIPEEKLKNIFRPFQSSKSKGMGLGLSFCKNTVESHGGIIKVESKVGQGTKFIIIIPKEIKNYIDNKTTQIQ